MMCNSLVLTQLLLCDLVFFMFFVKALPKILLFTEKCPFLNDNSPLCCRFML